MQISMSVFKSIIFCLQDNIHPCIFQQNNPKPHSAHITATWLHPPSEGCIWGLWYPRPKFSECSSMWNWEEISDEEDRLFWSGSVMPCWASASFKSETCTKWEIFRVAGLCHVRDFEMVLTSNKWQTNKQKLMTTFEHREGYFSHNLSSLNDFWRNGDIMNRWNHCHNFFFPCAFLMHLRPERNDI